MIMRNIAIGCHAGGHVMAQDHARLAQSLSTIRSAIVNVIIVIIAHERRGHHHDRSESSAPSAPTTHHRHRHRRPSSVVVTTNRIELPLPCCTPVSILHAVCQHGFLEIAPSGSLTIIPLQIEN